ncbi:hypothetical protein WMF31_23845 [Sorangium sp. So ce1036]|uniref:hypothetical protein n=1 Tax=Sorangium sp. So ce1036 TaxID=3133328 RepID=UPI003F1019BE
MGKRCAALTCVVGLLASPAAWAQDPAPPAVDPGAAPAAPDAAAAPGAAPAAPDAAAAAPDAAAAAPGAASAAPIATAPQAEPTATAGDMAAGTPAQGTAAPVAEPPAEASPIMSWFRFDADNLGLQLWAGASHPLGGPVSLSTDIYITPMLGTAEFDIGPAFTFGPVTLNPMVGFAFNFLSQEPAALVAPQLFTYVDAKPVYFESWLLGSFSSMFNENVQNIFYSRDFLLFSVTEDFSIGPHLELTVDLNEVPGATADAAVDDTGLSSLQVGGIVGLNYGTGNKLLLYLGYETQDELHPDNRLAGRFTFLHTW